MPVAISSTRRISIDVGDETVTFVCRPPSGADISTFLSARFKTKRNKVESFVYPARAAFFDRIVINAENATYEAADSTQQTLDAGTMLTDADKTKWGVLLGIQISGWKDLIPLSWKSSLAQRFEDSADAQEAETKN